MTPSSPALDRQRLSQSADLACAARHGILEDSAQRMAGRMRNAENHPPNGMQDSQPQKKRRKHPTPQTGLSLSCFTACSRNKAMVKMTAV